MATNIQAQGTGSELGCRITIDGVVKVERSSQGADSMCSVWTSPDEPQPSERPPRVPNLVRKLAIPIAIFWWRWPPPPMRSFRHSRKWVGSTTSHSPQDASAVIASQRVGKVFGEYDSDSLATIVIEGAQPLGEQAHRYGDALVAGMTADKKHVEHVQYFWGDPLTAAGSQSNDGKAALINAYLAGDAGGSQANESVIAVRDIVDKTPAPPGVKAYVSGPAALVADEFAVGERATSRSPRSHSA